jgi:predicted AlkP superfamily phosphohydrolase/phosphomutase
MNNRKNAILYILTHYEWDFSMVVFTETDRIHHRYLENYKKMSKFYAKLDRVIGEILEVLDKNTSTIIMSDHGFSRKNYQFFINVWLKDNGYLGTRKGTSIETRTNIWKDYESKNIININPLLVYFGITKENITSFLDKSRLTEYYNNIQKHIPAIFHKIIPQSNYGIDWSSTKVFLSSSEGQGLYINTEGRFTKGIVKEKDYSNLREEIIRKLKTLKFENKRVFDGVYKKEDIYDGPYLENAPDIILNVNKEFRLLNSFNSRMFVKNPIYDHSKNGILILNGKEFKKNKITKECNIVDIFPTILHYFDIPIPEDVDGKVIKEAFKNDKKVKKTHLSFKKRKMEKLSHQETEEIKDRLRSLGYLR